MADEEVFIAGGGIIGLSAALELARRGLHVTVAERGRPMREASWAAAGMLAAGDPENPPQLTPLSELSIERYPAYLRLVEQLSGLRVPLRTSRTLQHTHNGGRLWLDEHSLDPRDLCAALPSAVRAAGVHLLDETEVLDVISASDKVTVATSRGRSDAGYFIACCGAWSGALASLPVRPSKGQMAVVRLPLNSAPDYVLRTPELYLVPRGDGHVVVGATVENAGFDKTVAPEAIQKLLARAALLWPAVAEAEVVESWAGLRPESEDGLPVLGPYAGDRCLIATGHFRNGILLAPATAHLLGQIVCGEPPEIDLQPFRCDRFVAANVHS